MESPLVLLHGINMSSRAWDPVLPLLEPSHKVIAPTLAGHRGGPPLSDHGSGVVPFVDAVEKHLDDLGLSQVHLVGNSLGGWVAIELAQRGRALSVVAFSPAGAAESVYAERRLGLRLRSFDRAARCRLADGLVTGSSTRGLALRVLMEHADELTDRQVTDLVRDARGCHVLGDLLDWISDNGPLAPFDLPAGLPVRLAWPRTDRLLPWRTYGKAFHALVPSAELTFLEGVGHVPMYDDPQLVAETILSWTRCAGP